MLFPIELHTFRKLKYPEFKKTYYKIPEETLHSMKIVFSPFMEMEQKDKLLNMVEKYIQGFSGTNFLNSEREGAIRF